MQYQANKNSEILEDFSEMLTSNESEKRKKKKHKSKTDDSQVNGEVLSQKSKEFEMEKGIKRKPKHTRSLENEISSGGWLQPEIKNEPETETSRKQNKKRKRHHESEDISCNVEHLVENEKLHLTEIPTKKKKKKKHLQDKESNENCLLEPISTMITEHEHDPETSRRTKKKKKKHRRELEDETEEEKRKKKKAKKHRRENEDKIDSKAVSCENDALETKDVKKKKKKKKRDQHANCLFNSLSFDISWILEPKASPDHATSSKTQLGIDTSQATSDKENGRTNSSLDETMVDPSHKPSENDVPSVLNVPSQEVVVNVLSVILTDSAVHLSGTIPSTADVPIQDALMSVPSANDSPLKLSTDFPSTTNLSPMQNAGNNPSEVTAANFLSVHESSVDLSERTSDDVSLTLNSVVHFSQKPSSKPGSVCDSTIDLSRRLNDSIMNIEDILQSKEHLANDSSAENPVIDSSKAGLSSTLHSAKRQLFTEEIPNELSAVRKTSLRTKKVRSVNTSTIEVPEESRPIFQNSLQAVSKNSPQAVSKKSPRVVSNNSPRAVSKNSPRVVSNNSPQSVGKNSPQAVGENSPQAVSKNSPQAVVENSPQAVVENSPQAVVENSPQAVGRNSSQAVGRNSPQAVGRNSPQAVSKKSPQAVSNYSPQAVSKKSPQAVSKKSPQAVSKKSRLVKRVKTSAVASQEDNSENLQSSQKSVKRRRCTQRKSSLTEKPEKRTRHPDLPKQPVSVYLRFARDCRKQLLGKNLKLKPLEIGNRYRKLRAEDKEKYVNEFLRETKAYNAAIKQFLDTHPEHRNRWAGLKRSNLERRRSGCVEIISGEQLYINKRTQEHLAMQSDEDIKKVKANYRKEWKQSLDKQEKVVYILEAKKLNAMSAASVEDHRTEDSNEAKPVASSDYREIEEKFLTENLIPPPVNGYQLFIKENANAELRFGEVNRRWKRELSQEERNSYSTRAKLARETYRKNLAEFEKKEEIEAEFLNLPAPKSLRNTLKGEHKLLASVRKKAMNRRKIHPDTKTGRPPLTGRCLFVKERMVTVNNLNFKLRFVELNKQWKNNLSEEERDSYSVRAKAAYDKFMELYRNKVDEESEERYYRIGHNSVENTHTRKR